jgi:hypothetical protein
MSAQQLLDAAGRRRSPATLPGHHAGGAPANKGQRYPTDPPTVDEIVAVMRQAGEGWHGRRMRGLIVVLWRSGLRIHEAPVGSLFCVIDGPSRGRAWSASAVRVAGRVRRDAPPIRVAAGCRGA